MTVNQMSAMLEAHGMRLRMFWSHQKQCYSFDVVRTEGEGKPVLDGVGLMDIENFLVERGLQCGIISKTAQSGLQSGDALAT